MRHIGTAEGSVYLPKMLGIYERELTPKVEAICAQKPGLIVDVGAAEGYYAVGLAMRNPQAQVIAFEMEERGRLLLAEMARLNEVASRVEVRGKCEPHDLQAALAGVGHPVVVCDVEGYEERLLDPVAVPELRGASILVELHDFIVPDIAQKLETRFAPTHDVQLILEEPRSPADFPWCTLVTRLLPRFFLQRAVSELRPCLMSWLWMVPRQN